MIPGGARMTAAIANRIGLFGGPVLARHFTCLFAVVVVAVMGTAHAAGPLHADPGISRTRGARADRATSSRSLRLFPLRQPALDRAGGATDSGSDLRDLPVVRLHGDAHVEQFAIAQDAWGLDDFDDSARGPAAVDIVRFLGSIELVARQRSWEKDRDRLFDRFVERL